MRHSQAVGVTELSAIVSISRRHRHRTPARSGHCRAARSPARSDQPDERSIARNCCTSLALEKSPKSLMSPTRPAQLPARVDVPVVHFESRSSPPPLRFVDLSRQTLLLIGGTGFVRKVFWKICEDCRRSAASTCYPGHRSATALERFEPDFQQSPVFDVLAEKIRRPLRRFSPRPRGGSPGRCQHRAGPRAEEARQRLGRSLDLIVNSAGSPISIPTCATRWR